MPSQLQWLDGTPFDPAILNHSTVSLSAGGYCMTIRLDVALDQLIFEDENCLVPHATIEEFNCYNLGKTILLSRWVGHTHTKLLSR